MWRAATEEAQEGVSGIGVRPHSAVQPDGARTDDRPPTRFFDANTPDEARSGDRETRANLNLEHDCRLSGRQDLGTHSLRSGDRPYSLERTVLLYVVDNESYRPTQNVGCGECGTVAHADALRRCPSGLPSDFAGGGAGQRDGCRAAIG